jgi:molecular chaperone Hsp33
LADTLTAEEMLNLDCETLLHRLFNAEQVLVYPPDEVAFKCGCSVSKISSTLVALGRVELESILIEREHITVDCQYCGAQYQFDKVDVENMLLNPLRDGAHPTTRH